MKRKEVDNHRCNTVAYWGFNVSFSQLPQRNAGYLELDW